MNFLDCKNSIDRVCILTDQQPEFEETYLKIREKEKRILSDEMVSDLPRTPIGYEHNVEWKTRKAAAQKVLAWLKNTQPIYSALDVGCGNGWFTNQLHSVCQEVVGIDINLSELKQARRVFNQTTLNFCYAEVYSEKLTLASFDVITINAAIQYFPDIEKLLYRLLGLLAPDGEIHIIDSPFYSHQKIAAAKNRTRQYFEQINHPEMTRHYFHHCWNSLNSFNYRVMFDPETIKHRTMRKLGCAVPSFPWIIIKK